MNLDTLQLMLYGENLDAISITAISPDIHILSINNAENPQYSFVNIHISRTTSPGVYIFDIEKDKSKTQFSFPILQRLNSKNRYQGFDSGDVIYLITPDRFVNGDNTNDNVEGMQDYLRPGNMLGRHGGDIQGIIEKLDYLKDLGITALWINPLLENNMPISYHGYAVTDHYQIDPRFGTNELYKRLVNQAHEHDIKIIMDHVSNHIGINHIWMKKLPSSAWLNGSIEAHEQNEHNKSELFDVHADTLLQNNILNGWFTDYMPDLNQRDEYVEKYLIQNTIWWIEYTGLDGIREDTYPYADQEFMATWAQFIRNEYPEFNIVGEVWIHNPVFIAPFQMNYHEKKYINTHLPSVTDFGLFEAFGRIFNRGKSIEELYKFISRDMLYHDPDKLVTFLDNHDVMRLYDLVDGKIDRYIMALKLLLTIRGIPQIYYGTEIGISGGKNHGEIRRDFPGGFTNSTRNAFMQSGRNDDENSIYDKLKSLISIRTKHNALMTGEMIHFPVKDEFYVFLRKTTEQVMLMVANNNSDKRYISLTPYMHYFRNLNKLKNTETGKQYVLTADLSILIPGDDVGIFEVLIE